MRTILILILLSFVLDSVSAQNYDHVVNVTDKPFNADPTFTKDATAAIQKALNYLDSLGGRTKLMIPAGRYKIAGPLLPAHNNAQIYIPAHNILTTGLCNSIVIEGSPGLNSVIAGSYGSTISRMPQTGTILQSTVMGSGTVPSVLAADQGPNSRHFNYTDIQISNILIEVYTNSAALAASMTAFNMACASKFTGKKIMASTDTVNQKTIDPISNNVAGLLLSAHNNGGPNACTDCQFNGFTWGIVPGEHTILNNCYVFACDYGLMLPLNTYSVRGSVLLQAVKVPIFAPHLFQIFNDTYVYQQGATMVDLYAEIEHDTTGFWYDFAGVDVVDSAGFIYGTLKILANNSLGATTPALFSQGNATLAGNATVTDESTGNIMSPVSVKNSGGADAGVRVIGANSGSVASVNVINDQGGHGLTMELYGSTFGSGYSNLASLINYNTNSRLAFGNIVSGGSTGLLIMPATNNVNITNNVSEADIPSSLFTVSSTTKGAIPFPRLTNAQRDVISSPVEGTVIYSTTDHTIEFYNGSTWKSVLTN